MKGNVTKAIDYMKKNPGCTIVAHVLGSKRVYRLRDQNVNPIINILDAEFMEELRKGTFIQIEGERKWMLDN